MKIVFAFKECPSPPHRSGSRMRATTVLRSLERLGHDVRLIHFSDPGDPEIPGATAVPRPPGGLRRRFQEWMAPGAPLFRPNYESKQMRRAIEWASRDADLVILGQDQMAIYRDAAGIVPCLLDATDAWTLVLDSLGGGRYLRAHRERIRRHIEEHYHRFDSVLVVSDRDARELSRVNRRVRARVLPHAVNTDEVRPGGTESTRPVVLFVGVMNHAPNVEGAVRFARQIWPRIRRAVPEARFHIVGRDPVREVRALSGPGVEVVGAVNSVLPYLRSAWVVVCPLWSGAGMKTKVLEAMAAGRPVVATPEGATGIPAGIRVEELPSAFADSVSDLLRSRTLRAEEGAFARQVAVDSLSWRRLDSILFEVLEGTCRSVTRSA